MPPLRSNSVSTSQRGEVNVRICRTVRGERVPHEWGEWSAANVKSMRQLLTLSASRGKICREFSVDAMRKYPFWICATSGASPQGYMEVRADCLPGFSVDDHDTPVGPRMLLSTSGVLEMRVSNDATPFDNEKPQLQVSEEGHKSIFARAHRYLPTDAVSNARDFAAAWKQNTDPRMDRPEIVLLQSDNGWDYSMHSMMQQHLTFRNALLYDVVLFLWTPQAPKHSSWNPIERTWPVLRNIFLGQHLGASAYPEGVNPFQTGEDAREPAEDILRKICEAGVKDAYKLLSRNLPDDWSVFAPEEATDPGGDPKPNPEDMLEKIRAHYNGTRDEEVEQEASIIFDHVTKLGGVAYWLMCMKDFCPHCLKVYDRRNAEHRDLLLGPWSPENVLTPLRHNFYRPYLPELAGDNTGPADGEQPTKSLKPQSFDKVPEPFRAGRNPYRAFLDMQGDAYRNKKLQTSPRIPINPNRRRVDGVFQCTMRCKTHGQECSYFAKSKAEQERHERFAHQSAQPAPAPCPEAPVACLGDDPLPGYKLGQPVLPKPKKQKDSHGNAEADDVDMEEMLAVDFDHEQEYPEIVKAYLERQKPPRPASTASSSSAAPAALGALSSSAAPAAAPVASAESAVPAGPELASCKPPRSTTAWKVVQVPGGWLRFNKSQGRLDAHCERHGLNCKMDRVLHKGPIGLHMAWLADPAANKTDHDQAKAVLASHEGEDACASGRDTFMRLAATEKGLFQDIVEEESRATGGHLQPRKRARVSRDVD